MGVAGPEVGVVTPEVMLKCWFATGRGVAQTGSGPETLGNDRSCTGE